SVGHCQVHGGVHEREVPVVPHVGRVGLAGGGFAVDGRQVASVRVGLPFGGDDGRFVAVVARPGDGPVVGDGVVAGVEPYRGGERRERVVHGLGEVVGDLLVLGDGGLVVAGVGGDRHVWCPCQL